MIALASLVRAVAGIVVLLIVAAILLIVLGARESNDIVNWITDAGSWLSSPFHGIFNVSGRKGDVALNWGLAAVVYFIVAALITRLLLGADGGGRFGRRRRGVAAV